MFGGIFNLLYNSFDTAIEKVTNYVGTISSDHAYIHQGIKYELSKEFTLAIGGSYYIAVTTPSDTLQIHYRPEKIHTLSSPIALRLYEDVTFTGGVVESPINSHRDSANTASTVVTSNVATDVSGLTSIASIYAGTGGLPQSRSGGASQANEEIVLKQNTTYIIEIENVGDVATDVLSTIKFYEEDEYIQ